MLVPAALLGVALEWLVLGPLVASLAAGYAGLSLAPERRPPRARRRAASPRSARSRSPLVGRRIEREPVVAGLREEA